MNNKPLISVIVPVYKVEKYLDKCITSLVNQTYDNLEIILIDDGSPDNCPKMCDDWKKSDNRINVIHKKNEGLGMARNTGIKNAKGDYIIFVDSDDMIDVDTIENCYKKLKNRRYDIIYFGYKYIDLEDNIKKEHIPTPTKLEYFNDEVQDIFLPNLINPLPNETNFNLNMSSCMCLINLDLIKKSKWFFVSERKIISEDVYSMILLLKNIKSVCIIPKSYYSYRVNSLSLTHTYREDRFEKVKELYKELNKICNKKILKDRVDYLFLSYTIGCIKGIVSSTLKYVEKIREIKKISQDKELNEVINLYISKETKIRKIYFKTIKCKMINITYILTKLQIKRSVR